MKRFAILFSVAAVFVCVTAAYYLSYRLSGDRQTQEPQAPTTSFLQSPSGQRESEEALEAGDSQEILVHSQMDYTLEIYDAQTDSRTQQDGAVPVAMYGLDREGLITYLNNLSEQENRNLSETQVHYELVSFAEDSFRVRKTVTAAEPAYVIFLVAENGYLTAYTGDRMEVYEYTHIPLGDFPLEQQAMLTAGIYMETLTDYYDFLETYSS